MATEQPATKDRRGLRLLISAGEASGDLHGGSLLAALRRLTAPEALECFGMGGERLRANGCDTVIDAKDVAVVGLVEVLSHLPGIYQRFRRLLREIDRRRPDAAVLIDFPEFNFRLARQLHRRGIPVVYYISPQLWAWNQGRVKLVRRYVRKMLVIFPFERDFYARHEIAARFVGHPLADMFEKRDEVITDSGVPHVPPSSWADVGQFPRSAPQASELLTGRGMSGDPLPLVTNESSAAPDPGHLFPVKIACSAETDAARIALLPGSRRKEIQLNLPAMIQAARLLQQRHPGLRFCLPVASTVSRPWLEKLLSELGAIRPLAPELTDNAAATLTGSRAAIVASGTATLEAALAGTPFVMVYRVAPLTWLAGRWLVNVPFYCIVNLIAGRAIVPELVQHDFTPARVAGQIELLLPEGPERRRMLQDLAGIRAKLRGESGLSASEQAAREVLEVMRGAAETTAVSLGSSN